MMSASQADVDRAGLYRHSAELFDLRYAQKNYASEAAVFSKLLDRIHPSATTLLDVACGTARHLEHLRARYRVEGLDLSSNLLQLAKSRLVDVPLHQGDMFNFNLNRTFDLVTCFFGSIAMCSSLEELRHAVSCMVKHLSPDGILFVEPFLTPSAYREDEVVHNFRQAPKLKASWMYVMRRKGLRAVWDIHWLVGACEDGVTHFVEHEEYSLFTTDECFAAMRDVGLDVFHHTRGLHGYGAFLGRRKHWSADESAVINGAFSS